MAGGIQLDYSQMDEVAATISATSTSFEESLTTLVTVLDGLVASGFVTETASASFQDAYTRWNTAQKTCTSSLEEMSTYLKQASSAFKDLDTQFTIK